MSEATFSQSGHHQGLVSHTLIEYGFMAPAIFFLVYSHPDWLMTSQGENKIFKEDLI